MTNMEMFILIYAYWNSSVLPKNWESGRERERERGSVWERERERERERGRERAKSIISEEYFIL